MLYMLFFASCIHSLKKFQLETKRVGNKRQAYNYKKSFLVLSLVFVKKIKKSFSDFYTNYFFFNTYDVCKQFILSF